jgi:uncharacterized protein (UPF0335 family)
MSDTNAETNVASFPAGEDEATSTTKSSSDAIGDVGGITGDRLRSFIERVERLEEEKAALAEDLKEVYGEAKSSGFDVKIMRKIVSLRKMDSEKRQEEEHLLELYKSAIGMG